MQDPLARRIGLRRSARLHASFRVPAGRDGSPHGPHVSGELTFLVGTDNDPDRPQFRLGTLNLVFDPSPELGGGDATPSACLPAAVSPEVEFDERTRELVTQFELNIDAPARWVGSQIDLDPENHTPGPAPVSTTAELRGRFVTDLRPVDYRFETFDGQLEIRTPRALLDVIKVPILVVPVLIPMFWFRWAPRRQLCVQPVFIAASGLVPATGSDFYPGLARANEMWGGCCLQFVAKCPPIYVQNQDYRVSTMTEATAFKDEVTVADAVEVFVVERLEPEETWGGGATFGSGTAAAKVVTGDNQLPLNRNHLAHELGHVLGLIHPGDQRAGVVAGCAGSVMEPSGFFADNPDLQCEANCHNASNPLLCTLPHDRCLSVDRPDDQLF
ncbi:MAG: hypothetical protein ACR2QE_20275 [Acidimicrobiales bacterium]